MSRLIATGIRRSCLVVRRCGQAPMVVPSVLDPFAEEAAPAVMTRIALDWMIEGTSIEPILDAVSEGQYTREFLLGHFVQVMCDVACGFRYSPRDGIPEASTRPRGFGVRFLPQARLEWNPAYPPLSCGRLPVEPAS